MSDEKDSGNQPEAKKKNRWFFMRNLPLETETSFFILANALDAIMTKLLLNFKQFRESNVLADYILDNYGMQGMVYFKFIIVAVVAIIAQIIAVKNLRAAKNLLIFGSIIVFAVVIYSCYLWVRHSGFFMPPEAPTPEAFIWLLPRM